MNWLSSKKKKTNEVQVLLPELKIHLQWALEKAYQVGEQGQECIHQQHPLILGWPVFQSHHLYPVKQTMLNL